MDQFEDEQDEALPTIEELLDEIVDIQLKQLYWIRVTGMIMAVSSIGVIFSQCVAKH